MVKKKKYFGFIHPGNDQDVNKWLSYIDGENTYKLEQAFLEGNLSVSVHILNMVDSPNPLLEIYSIEILIHKWKLNVQRYNSTSFMSKNQEQPKCPLILEWMNHDTLKL